MHIDPNLVLVSILVAILIIFITWKVTEISNESYHRNTFIANLQGKHVSKVKILDTIKLREIKLMSGDEYIIPDSVFNKYDKSVPVDENKTINISSIESEKLYAIGEGYIDTGHYLGKIMVRLVLDYHTPSIKRIETEGRYYIEGYPDEEGDIYWDEGWARRIPNLKEFKNIK